MNMAPPMSDTRRLIPDDGANYLITPFFYADDARLS